MLKLLKYLKKREWLYVLGAVVFIVGKVYLALLMPDYMSAVTLIAQGGTNPVTGLPYQMGDIWINGGMMLLCALGNSVCSIIVAIFATRLAADFSARLRELVYRKVQGFSLDEMNEFTTASLITRTTNDIQQVQSFVITSFDLVFRAPITIIWVIAKMSVKQWGWTLAVAVAVVFMVIGILILIFTAARKYKKLQALTDNLNQVTRENVNGIRVVRAYNAEKYQEEKFEDINDSFTKTNLFTTRTLALMGPFITLIMNGVNLAVYWIGAYIINSATPSEYMALYSDMMIYISYSMVIVSAFLTLTMSFMVAPRALVSANRIKEVLEKEEHIEQEEEVGKTEEVGAIEFKDVSFRYPEGNDVLSSVSFKVNRGDTVAIIGPTGCGKSSLVNLVTRFYDATGGEVLVDGHNVKEYPKNELAKKIGYVSQKPVLFSGTVRSNVNFGDNDADEEKIRESLEISQSRGFVENKEGGIDARVAQHGTNFSGGQKQRLSIARSVARDPEIYIFDDALSALDYRTDRALRKALKEEAKDATFLIVAQRIGTILDANKIIVLEDGKIVGQGTHKELLERCETYREIAKSQLSEETLR